MIQNIGVVILNYNTYDALRECIKSINEKEKNPCLKIYIVDNGSTDESKRKIIDDYANNSNYRLILLDDNKGFSAGMNAGIIEANKDGCKVVFLLNSDIVLMNDAISEMSKCFIGDVVAVGPAVFDRNNNYISSAQKVTTLLTHIFSKRGLDKFSRRFKFLSKNYNVSKNEKLQYFEGMCGGCVFGLDMNFIMNNGLLDENLFLYFEEDVLAYKIIKNKKLCCICNDAMVMHIGHVSIEKLLKKNQFTRMCAHVSAIYVLKKYAQTNNFFLIVYILCDVLLWGIYSIFSYSYRSLFCRFISEIVEIMKK